MTRRGLLSKLSSTILSYCAYAVAWAAFASSLDPSLPRGKLMQTASVVIAAAACVPTAFFFGTLATGISAGLSLACILFLAYAAGPNFGVVAPSLIPTILALALGFPAPAAAGSAAVALAALLAALGPHSAWGLALPGVNLVGALVLVSVGAVVFALGALLRAQDRRAGRLEAELERLDSAYHKVVHANLDFQTYALLVREEAMENERRRIAGEIHDIIGYTLTNLIMLIQAAQYGKGGPEATKEILQTARDHANEGLSEARRSLAALRAEDPGRPRGANLFLRLTSTFADVTGITVRTNFANLPTDLPHPTEKILYRVIQEGLTNAFRHGRASAVDVDFWRADGEVTVLIRDNGTTAASDERRDGDGIGLAGLRERVEELGGRLYAEKTVDGFVLKVRIPLGEIRDGS